MARSWKTCSRSLWRPGRAAGTPSWRRSWRAPWAAAPFLLEELRTRHRHQYKGFWSPGLYSRFRVQPLSPSPASRDELKAAQRLLAPLPQSGTFLREKTFRPRPSSASPVFSFPEPPVSPTCFTYSSPGSPATERLTFSFPVSCIVTETF